MATKEVLKQWVIEAVAAHNGEATIAQICKYVWENHEPDLQVSGNLLYTWGYDIRWAGQRLRDNGYLQPSKACKRGVWVITSKGRKAATSAG